MPRRCRWIWRRRDFRGTEIAARRLCAAGGELLLAKRGDHVLGCIGLKALAPPDVAEIKRLFVRPQARGAGVAKALVAAVHRSWRRPLGYGEIKLDTLPEMDGAIALYKSFGFVPIPPYGSHPYPGLVTLGKILRA